MVVGVFMVVMRAVVMLSFVVMSMRAGVIGVGAVVMMPGSEHGAGK